MSSAHPTSAKWFLEFAEISKSVFGIEGWVGLADSTTNSTNDGGDRPHGQRVVGAPKSPRRNFVMSPLYAAKRYSKNYVIMKLKKLR